MNSTAHISFNIYNSELGLVTQGGKVVWGKLYDIGVVEWKWLIECDCWCDTYDDYMLYGVSKK